MVINVSQYVDAEQGLISGEIFHSQALYEQELEQVFARSWLFLAHDSMIPNTGDFLQTYIGEDPVLIVRQADGGVKAFLNQCRHRGMRICRADLGNARAFTCTYHGWAYDIAGNLVNVPHEEDGYRGELDKSAWGPVQVTKLESYKGFWFGNWDADAPSLDEYLGEMKFYFDSHIDRFEGGVEAIAVHKWVLPCNWKFNAEQPSHDAYHAQISHASAIAVMTGRTDPKVGEVRNIGTGTQYGGTYGHGTGFRNVRSRGNTDLMREWNDATEASIKERLGEEGFGARGHANIFPNFSFLGNGTMRVGHPRGPQEMEIWAWTFVPVTAPAEIKEQMRVDVLRTFSPGGMFEQDDGENWGEEQKVLRGFVARRSPLLYAMGLGYERWNADGFPGRTVDRTYCEEGARALYQHWADMMNGQPWPEIKALKAERQEAFEAKLAAKASKESATADA